MNTSISVSTVSGGKTKDEFINKAHEARQARELVRRRDRAATIIQAFLKANNVRKNLKNTSLNSLDDLIKADAFPSNGNVLLALRKTLFVCHPIKDRITLDNLIQLIISTSSPNYNKKTSLDEIKNKVDTPKSLIEDAIKESIELSSDHALIENIENNLTNAHSIAKIGHKNIVILMAENSLNSDKSFQHWLHLLERILNLCLNYLEDENSTRLDSQHINNYLNIIDLFTSSKTLSCMIEQDTNEALNMLYSREDYRKIIEKLSEQLLVKTLFKRKQFFQCITKLVCERISRFRNDLKTSILGNYVNITIKLLRLDKLPSNCLESNNPTDSTAPATTATIKILIHLLSIPSFINNLEKHSPKSLVDLNQHSLTKVCIKLLSKNQNFHELTSTSSLCLLANLVHLAHLNEDVLAQETTSFVILCTKILESCQKNMLKSSPAVPGLRPAVENNNNKRLNESMDVVFNPILGWLVREEAVSIDKEVIKAQLSHLWCMKFLKIMLVDLIQVTGKSNGGSYDNNRQKNVSPIRTTYNNLSNCDVQPRGLFRRAVERATTTMTRSFNSPTYSKTTGVSSNSGRAKLMTPETNRIASVCLMLHTSLKTLTTLKQDILTGLCLHDYILPKLWNFINSLGPNNGLKAFLEHLTIYTKTNSPEFYILILFCECASHLISILDDSELYEKQQPFQLEDLIAISAFLNNFVFRVICNQLVPIASLDMDPILKSTHKLLTDLYKRDCRRPFAPQDHWLIKDIKMSMFLKDLEAGKPVAKALKTMLPHIIPHKERVIIFRKLVAKDRAQFCTSPSTLITIHRSRIVEDGYQQLIRLSPHALKGLIRVKFVNDFGLDEAGIDQDGVFKEFLEDTIKRVFDPALNLFCSTSEQRLYPSPTSRLHEDYLSLFNFVGKMLGKAVYEGIVVDVPFASFFLSRVLGQPQSPLYSPIDELPSLDPELYKSLTYIKHYEGDVSELDLTFSIDQDFMGKIETHELESGGKSLPVTRESRVRYIHSVANFRMKTQIEKQTEAFVSGFRSIINLDWLSMFSASEFQRLISGDNTPIDLQDLRRHTKYFGGFHNNHRVVCWLWDILEKDFSAEEHRLFLKFVTSCSKPPLLGFSNLEPPFSIRCVEVSDDQDLGDTVGSVLRGFFAIRRSDPVDRLPTSSTCFNLLKLPNYQRRSTLREKLRYAILSNPGFELS